MRQLNKKTLALILASVVTVAGSFAADNYKNSLTGLEFSLSNNGSVNMIVKTKTAYNGNVSPIKKDANTYVLMLPEINSIAPNPDLNNISSYVSSVNVRTMPYSANGSGYTKITITTNNVQNILATNQVYLPAPQEPAKLTDLNAEVNDHGETNNDEYEQHSASQENNINNPSDNNNVSNAESSNNNGENSEPQNYNEENNAGEQPYASNSIQTKNDPTEKLLVWLGILTVILCSLFFAFRANSKLKEIAGEEINISLDDEDEQTEKKKKITKKVPRTNLRDAINAIDNSYAKTASMAMQQLKNNQTDTDKPEEDLNIVDLDELFNESQSTSESDEENAALDDFLSDFSFLDDDELEKPKEEEIYTFDEQVYEEVVNKNDLKFSKNDLDAISQLIGVEITDDAKQNIEKYAVSNPIKKTLTKQQVLENIVTTYKINQNINFNHNDVEIIRKLISVEIDSDFVKDLRTNPELTKKMYEDMQKHSSKPTKATEILTLKVKDMLPNLEEALLNQDYSVPEKQKRQAPIYYSEGYDVSTIKVKSLLPDISEALKNKDSYVSKPSVEVPIADESYVNKTLNVADELPDLQDVLANPDKYKEPEKEPFVADEETLLNSIKNVQFKDFAEGHEFEVLNHFDDEPVPTVSDIQKEFSQFENFSITTENEVSESTVHEKPEFKSTGTDDSNTDSKYVIDNIIYDVIDSVQLLNNKGCHLTKGNGKYVVLGYEGDKLFVLKEYDELKSEKIQARANGKELNGIQRFIIRVGANKFIVDIENGHLKYVMDLC